MAIGMTVGNGTAAVAAAHSLTGYDLDWLPDDTASVDFELNSIDFGYLIGAIADGWDRSGCGEYASDDPGMQLRWPRR